MESDIDLNVTVAKKIRDLRSELGLSQKQLADIAGVSIIYLTYLENESNIDSTIRVLSKLAKALGVKPDTLLT